MKQFGKFLAVIICLGMIIFLGINAYWDLVVKFSQPEIVSAETMKSAQVTRTPFMPVAPTAIESTPTSVPPTPTPFPVQNYVLGEKIDLENGGPIALVVRLSDGSVITSNWAQPIGYKGTDPDEVFLPGNGTVYSYLGDITSTWAHSGIYRGKKIFATNLELYLRVKPQGGVRSLEEGKELIQTLVGGEAYLCQMPEGSVQPLSDFEVTEGCLGQKLTLRISAAVIVPHELVEDYDNATMTTKSWLINNIPEAGFEDVMAENGWLFKFCVGEFGDQAADGTPSYLFNRAVLGFTLDP